MKNLEPKDCTFDMDLMEERHGFWHYGLSMEVMEEKCSKEIKAYANFTENFFETWALLLAFDLNEKGNIAEALEELVTFMEKLKPILRTFGSKEICKIITKNLTGKKLCGYVGENYRLTETGWRSNQPCKMIVEPRDVGEDSSEVTFCRKQ
ncbi:unnamed protein product [Arabidopsis lyrata]|nr:unnamed protein product [Arabidopsis lyrata]